jgi:leader peptidase (prepilin peptidase)/N-methyltransferase
VDFFAILIIFLFGTSVGSFLNVVIHRIPLGESIVFPASHCPKCGNNLKWYHNIPLFSWLFLGGKCAFCKEKISPRYPIIELLNGLLWVVIFLKLGFVWYLPFVMASFSALLALSAIDFEYFAVPDSVNFFALVMALINPKILNLDLTNPAINALIAAGGLWLIGFLTSKMAKKEAMGGADVIVAGTMAALLGLGGFFVALFISALLAMIPSLLAKDTMVPFVPFLSMGTLIVFLYDNQIMQLVKSLIYG